VISCHGLPGDDERDLPLRLLPLSAGMTIVRGGGGGGGCGGGCCGCGGGCCGCGCGSVLGPELLFLLIEELELELEELVVVEEDEELELELEGPQRGGVEFL